MADNNKIIQELELRGDEEVKRRLASVGDEGAKSLDKLAKAGSGDLGKNIEKGLEGATQAASNFSGVIVKAAGDADNAGGSLGNLGGIAQNVAGAFDSVALKIGAAVAVIAAAVTAATTAMATVGATAASKVEDSAKKLGLTADAYQKLEDTAGEAGASSEQLGSAIGKLNAIADETNRAFFNLANGAKSITQAWIRAEDATLNLTKAQRELANAADDAARAQLSADLSLKGSKLGLLEAENALAKARGQLPPHQERALAIEKAELAVKQAKLSLEKSEQDADEASAKASEDSGRRILAVEKAVLAITEAGSASFQKYRDTIHQFGESSVQVLRNAGSVIQGASSSISSFGKNATRETIQFENATVRVIRFGQTLGALPGKVNPAQTAIQQLGINLQKFARLSPEERLRSLAVAFGNISDPARQAALASAIFGDNWRAMLPVLDNIRKSMKETGDSTRHFTQQEIKAATALKGAQADLGEAISRTLQKIGLLFAPRLTANTQWMTGLVDGARDLLFALLGAQKERDKLLKPPGEGEGDTWAGRLFKAVERFKTAGATAFTTLSNAQTLLVNGFKAFFSGDFEGSWNLFKRSGTAAVVAITDGLTNLRRRLAQTFPDLVPFWNTFKRAGIDAFASVKSGLSSLGESLKLLLAGDFAGAWTNFKQAGVSAFTALKQLMAPVWQEFQRAGDASWETISRAQASFASAFRNLFQGNFTQFWQDLARSAGAAWSVIRTTGQSAWKSLTTDGEAAFTDLSSSQRQFESGFERFFKGDFTGAWDRFVGAGKRALSAFGKFLEAVSDTLKRTFGIDVSAPFLKIALGVVAAVAAFALLRTVLAPALSLVFTLTKAFLSFNPVVLAIGLALANFWQKFAKNAQGAVKVLDVVRKAFGEGIKKLIAGDLAGAWTAFKTAGVAVWREISAAATAFFGPIRAAFTGLTAILAGLATVLNAVFGTKLTATGVALLVVLAQLTGAFQILALAGVLLSVAFNPAIRVFALIAAAALVLYRLFPDIGASIGLLASAGRKFLSGDLLGAIQDVRSAFSGFFKNLSNEGPLTFLLLAGAAVVFIKVLATATGALTVFAARVAALTFLFRPLIAALSALKIIDDVTQKIDENQGAMERITAEFAKTGNIEKYRSEMEALFNTTKQVAGATEAGATDIGSAWQKMRDSVKGAFSGIPGEATKAVADTVTVIRGGVSSTNAEWDKAKPPNFKHVSEAAKKAFDDSQKLFQDINTTIDQSLSAVQKSFDAVGTASSTAAGTARTSFDTVTQSVDAVKSGAEATGEAVKKLDQNATLDKMTQAAEAVHQGIEKDKRTLQSLYDLLSQPIENRLKGFKDSMVAEFTETIASLKKHWQDFVDTLPAPKLPAEPSTMEGLTDFSSQSRRRETNVPDWTVLNQATQLLSASFNTFSTSIAEMVVQLQAKMAELTAPKSGPAAAEAPGAKEVQTPEAAISVAATNIISAITTATQSLSTTVETGLSNLSASTETISGAVNSADANIRGAVDAASSAIVQAVSSAAQTIVSAVSSSDGGGINEARASGGAIRGSGTSTSDSILAWLSRGEFVQPARAVRKYGLRFMEAIRTGRLDLERLRGFNAGGLVDNLQVALAPRFNLGGLAPSLEGSSGGSRREIALYLEGQRLGNVTGTDPVMNALEREAVKQQMASAGRSPRWRR